MFCQYCGAQTRDDLQFCTNCGRELVPAAPLTIAPFEPQARGEIRIGHWFSAGWEIIRPDLSTWMIISLLFLIVSGVPLVQGPLMVGMHIAAMRKMLLGRLDIGDLFKGFNYFLPALVASLIIGSLSFIGFLACIIPGLVVLAMYKFTWLFIVDKKMDFWPAMEASHAVVKKNGYFNFVMFLIAGGLFNLVGVLLCIVPVLITMPITFAAITVAYQDLVGFETHGETLGNGPTV